MIGRNDHSLLTRSYQYCTSESMHGCSNTSVEGGYKINYYRNVLLIIQPFN